LSGADKPNPGLNTPPPVEFGEAGDAEDAEDADCAGLEEVETCAVTAGLTLFSFTCPVPFPPPPQEVWANINAININRMKYDLLLFA
jgi:hypothetical protein